jgi:hypothetical protein
MVSGFFTSPCDQLRIFSGEASPMRMAAKFVGSLCFSNKLKILSKVSSSQEEGCVLLDGFRYLLEKLDVEAKALQLLDEDVEALGDACLMGLATLDD